MIAWIKGTVKDRFEDRVILDQGGIGYEVQLSILTASTVNAGDERQVYIYTYVREDILSLFGFATWNERELFLQLIKVSGIGARTAMGILSALEPGLIVQAIVHKDVATLQSVKGIGRKAAEKIVLELSDRMKEFQLASKIHMATSRIPHPHEDVVSALINLGYKKPAAEMALAKIDLPEAAGFDQILRETLKVLGK